MRSVLAMLVMGLAVVGCQSDEETWRRGGTPMGRSSDTTGTPPSDGVTDLQKIDLKEGTGPEAKTGDTVDVQYTGWLKNGTKFDSSYDHGGQPFSFTLGAGRVIKGWDLGVVGMKVGGKRKLIIPPELGYGGRNMGKIPPNSELTFEVELVKIK